MKARILLKADVGKGGEGWSDSRIIEALGTSPSMLYRVRKQLVEEGFEAVLSRKQRATPPVTKIFDGEKEARLIALACSEPPKGYVRWTLRLLEEKVVELKIVDKASDNTIGGVLKKKFSNRTSETNGLSRPRLGRSFSELLTTVVTLKAPSRCSTWRRRSTPTWRRRNWS